MKDVLRLNFDFRVDGNFDFNGGDTSPDTWESDGSFRVDTDLVFTSFLEYEDSPRC
jgi:hypothetical protein